MSDKTISFLDRLLVIPLVAYFWWYEWRQKTRTRGRKLSKLSVERHYYIHVSSMAVASADGRDAMIGTSRYAGLVVTKIEKLGKEESE